MPDNSPIQQFYERRSDHFWDPFRDPAGRERDLWPLVPECGEHALDYGFGSGALMLLLARRFTRVTGVEISTTQIAKVRERVAEVEPALLERLSFLHTTDQKLPQIPDASVDFIVCAAVIEHVLDPYLLMDELRRVSKPQGILLLTTPNLAYLKHRLTLLAGELPKTGTDDPVVRWRQEGWDGGHLHYFTRDTLSTLLRDCGWEPQQWTGSGDRWGWLRHWRQRYPTVLSGELIVRAQAR